MKKEISIISPTQQTQAFGWKFWLWLASAFSVVLIVAIISTAWGVQNSRYAIFGLVAEFPDLVGKAIQELWSDIEGNPLPLLIDRRSTESSGWIRRFPTPEDTGYLLFSGVDPERKQSVVQLIRIYDGKSVALWNPDWSVIFNKTSGKRFSSLRSFANALAFHPLLLSNGDIIFNTNKSLVRQSPCFSKPVWVLDEIMHHSNEFDESGAGLWVLSVSHDGLTDNRWLQDNIRDDALAHVSTDGVVLEKRSFARILKDNGLKAMLLGMFGPRLNTDPIHLNQIKVALQDSKHWNRGDLLISARHLSTLFLYRPSTNKIIWYKTGPWMNQHSVDFIDDHRISVFDNNVVSGTSPEYSFMSPNDTNQVMVYDFDTQQVSQPFEALLAKARPITITEGRARILPDGGLFLEETNYGRHLRFTKDKLLWSRVNDYDDKRIGMVSWSRYLTAEEARIPLQVLASRQCQAAR